MTDEIRVKVNSYGPERPLALVYFDPVSGKKVAKSAGTNDWREAERLAGELERELRAGRHAPPSKVTWGQFVERYTQEKLAALRPASRRTALESLRRLERTLNPAKLNALNAAALSRFQSELRKSGVKETTVARHLRHIKAALRWAERQGMLTKAP
ncbi:MAG: site-specific integrase, partial [Thermogutta sp.]|nr:site-specific integrase [Thermogutta sp.]